MLRVEGARSLLHMGQAGYISTTHQSLLHSTLSITVHFNGSNGTAYIRPLSVRYSYDLPLRLLPPLFRGWGGKEQTDGKMGMTARSRGWGEYQKYTPRENLWTHPFACCRSSAFASSSAAGFAAPAMASVIIVLNIRKGGRPCHQVPAMGIATHNKQFIFLRRALVNRRSQVAVIPLMTTASSQQQLCLLRESWHGGDGSERNSRNF